ncbi:unnamed protein product [Rotaria socialis]|uniref:Uncharacterized protein n=1 Tax=Rotaria socialis TaxID=392032 RepID=A0A820XDC6_9BILA|nr:unnamed protein product [Rotaria socialis]CAF3372483.1 unnamed protein product [Rotaria socialis]CAF3491595.1 unnamed protein product [Rotaria socialis]CAF4526927.1 unnamed protein product [Rotaria socialis]CAF4558045.1 unnamed protein product [Rotaria socialis]
MGCGNSVQPVVSSNALNSSIISNNSNAFPVSQNIPTTSHPIQAINANQLGRRNVENFVLMWLDATQNQNELSVFRSICNEINLFSSIDMCLAAIASVKNEIVFVIVSGTLGQQFVSLLRSYQQIDSVYIFCSNKQKHQQWSSKFPIIKGVFTDLKSIYTQILSDKKRVGQSLIGFNLIRSRNTVDSKNVQEVEFMYAQLIKDALLQLQDTDVTDMIACSRAQYEGNTAELNLIHEFQRNYKDSSQAIEWYTRESFVYKMLNKALRTMDIDVMYAFRVYIRHLHEQLNKLVIQQSAGHNSTLTLYRGQGLSKEEFKGLKSNEGGFFSVKTFLSTSSDEKTSIWFAKQCQGDVIKILLKIYVDFRAKLNVPLADIASFSDYAESEYLISMGSIFRIDKVSEGNDGIWLVSLSLTAEGDPDLSILNESFKRQYRDKHPIHQLFLITHSMGHPAVKKFGSVIGWGDYNVDAKTSADADNAKIRVGLQTLLEQVEKALQHTHEGDPALFVMFGMITAVYVVLEEPELALDYNLKQLRCLLNNPQATLEHMTTTLEGVARKLMNKKDYSNAVRFHKLSLDQKQIKLPDNHPDIADSYNQIATCHYELHQFQEALSNAQKAVSIARQSLPNGSTFRIDYEKNLQRIQIALNQ